MPTSRYNKNRKKISLLVLYKTKLPDDIKPNTNPKTNPDPNNIRIQLFYAFFEHRPLIFSLTLAVSSLPANVSILIEPAAGDGQDKLVSVSARTLWHRIKQQTRTCGKFIHCINRLFNNIRWPIDNIREHAPPVLQNNTIYITHSYNAQSSPAYSNASFNIGPCYY